MTIGREIRTHDQHLKSFRPHHMLRHCAVRWATGRKLTNRRPKLSLVALCPPGTPRVYSNYLHYLTFRWEPMADPMDAHGLPRHPTRSPVGAHGIPRGRPWASMGIHDRACGIPRAPTQGAVGSHGSCRAAEHGLPIPMNLRSINFSVLSPTWVI